MAKRPVPRYDFTAFGTAIKAARTNRKESRILLEHPTGKNTQRRQLDAMLDKMIDEGIQIVAATAREILEVVQTSSSKMGLCGALFYNIGNSAEFPIL